MSTLRRLAAAIGLIAVVSAAFPTPSDAGLFSSLTKKIDGVVKRPPPTAPPQHRAGATWDWVGKPEWVTMQPPLKAVTYVEECRWVDYKKPFRWGFKVTNKLTRPVSLRWTPFGFKKDYLIPITDTYMRISTLAPGASAYVEGDAPLGCPNMRGGQSPAFYYYVIGDDVRYAGSSRYLREGFFESWNRRLAQIREEREQEQIRQEQAMAQFFQGLAVASCYASDGCEVVNY